MAASLLSRLELASDPTLAERYTRRDSDVESAVTAHLAQLLNTRQGSCQTCPDYGLIEVSEVLYDFPDAIGIVQRALKNTIQTYEPRLKNVQVRHIKNDYASEMTLQFEITAQLHLPDGRRQSLRFATNVDGSGNVKMGG
jgi:type VI secretion system protein